MARAPRTDTSRPAPPPERYAPATLGPAPPAPRAPGPRAAPSPRKATAEADSRAAPAQRAAGGGGGRRRGNAGRRAVSTGDAAARRAALARWGAGIRRNIERGKRYPRGARGGGTVTVQLTVSRDGALRAARVVASSGVAALDRAALEAVRRTRLPAAPKGLSVPPLPFQPASCIPPVRAGGPELAAVDGNAGKVRLWPVSDVGWRMARRRASTP